MDYNNDKDMWDWQGDLQEDVSKSVWSNLNCEYEDDISYMFDDEATPVRACENIKKRQAECSETSSQVKRRRMLQFDTEVLDVFPHSKEDISSTFLRSKEREDFVKEAISDISQWVSEFADDTSASVSGYDGLESSENWLADCLNDAETHISSDDINSSEASDVYVDITGLDNIEPLCEASTVQQRPPARPQRRVTFKGKKSYNMKTTTKVASSIVVYPFSFLKPCSIQGDVTLKDINKRILNPPPLKPKQQKEDATEQYPTSAFSGKPVVGKTKIHTQGGKGSITIMRTKG